MKCRRIDSPFEYGYGRRQTAANRARNTIAIIAVPHRTKDGGISPMSLRTFSERSSILSWVLFDVSIFSFRVQAGFLRGYSMLLSF